jgi:hypothetical protein
VYTLVPSLKLKRKQKTSKKEEDEGGESGDAARASAARASATSSSSSSSAANAPFYRTTLTRSLARPAGDSLRFPKWSKFDSKSDADAAVAAGADGGRHRFSRFNKALRVLAPTREEYVELLKHPCWSEEETSILLDLAYRYVTHVYACIVIVAYHSTPQRTHSTKTNTCSHTFQTHTT